MKNHWHDAETAISGLGVARLAHVVTGESILDVEVDVEDVMYIVRLDDSLKFFVFSTDLLQILGIESLLGEIDEDTPAPVLLLHGIFKIGLHLYADESTCDEERHDILRLADYLSDGAANLLPLHGQLFLLPD